MVSILDGLLSRTYCGYYFYNFSSLALRRWHDFSLSSLRLKGEGFYIPEGDINLIYSGFENAYFGKKQYDLIISNPPYGREVINDIFYPDLSGLIIHHWFVAKSAKIIKDKGIIAMVVPQFFLDNVKDHARDIIHDKGVNMLAAYRLPDNLFTNAQVTVDIVFLQKAKTSIKWLITKNITIGKYTKPMNEYFIDHPEHVLGKLQIVPMYDRTGLTCKANGSLRDMLYAACLKIKRLI